MGLVSKNEWPDATKIREINANHAEIIRTVHVSGGHCSDAVDYLMDAK